MTSPMGWALGDARIPEHDSPQIPGRDPYQDPFGDGPYPNPWGYLNIPHRGRHQRSGSEDGLAVSRQERSEAATLRESARRREEAGLVQVAVPAILAHLLSSLPSLFRLVRLCDLCLDEHFKPSADNQHPCHQVECECWCTQGTGQ